MAKNECFYNTLSTRTIELKERKIQCVIIGRGLRVQNQLHTTSGGHKCISDMQTTVKGRGLAVKYVNPGTRLALSAMLYKDNDPDHMDCAI